jgi:hypothetical protein
MTAMPSLSAGTTPTAAQWQTLLPAFVRKTSDQTVNNSNVLVNDSQLVVSVSAGAVYRMSLLALQNSGATPGFKFAFTMPAGATFLNGYFDCGSSQANRQFAVVGAGGTGGVTGAAADSVVKVEATILIGGTAGSVQFQWCQSTANASNTIVRAGSSLLLTQVV